MQNPWQTGQFGQNFQQSGWQSMRQPSAPLDYNRLTQGVRADPQAMEEAANMAFRAGIGPAMPQNPGPAPTGPSVLPRTTPEQDKERERKNRQKALKGFSLNIKNPFK
jgi:hypothetical protein